MTEDEYIDATALSTVVCVKALLREIFPGKVPTAVFTAMNEAEEQLRSKIRIAPERECSGFENAIAILEAAADEAEKESRTIRVGASLSLVEKSIELEDAANVLKAASEIKE